jgi:hypothetical protein
VRQVGALVPRLAAVASYTTDWVAVAAAIAIALFGARIGSCRMIEASVSIGALALPDRASAVDRHPNWTVKLHAVDTIVSTLPVVVAVVVSLRHDVTNE